MMISIYLPLHINSKKAKAEAFNSERIASVPTVYSHLGCETKVIFTFVSHPFYGFRCDYHFPHYKY
ncbi:hypothetical protein CI088_04790 [Enterococcus plantarum]|uniref:Uncharacterized protein n=1 Tax=Enterococcus plantarum TaxID=1077675 RepID=A0A2W3Z641_9ENTE|nr:hypothetical protein CI088_04790 [Enterococcus plantarum]